MGQNNECCSLPFGESTFNINEVKIHWPEVAQEILNLRQQNKVMKLMRNQNNVQENNKSLKNIKKVYKQFFTRDCWFFGYVDYVYGEQSNNKASEENNSFINSSKINNFKKRKSSNLNLNSKQKQKQNLMTLDFLPSKIRLNDYGILIVKEKACYKGYFKNNQFHGRGFESILQNQQRFEGIYEKGMRKSGIYQNLQIKYQGEYKNGKMEGKSKIIFKKTNDLYEGEVKNGKMNGKGKIIYQNGDVYQGMFQNGLYNGEGTYVWTTGEMFKGSYRKGKKHGFGILTIEGKAHELCWVNDRAEGKPLNYKQYQTKKQIQISKSRKQLRINKEKHERQQIENDYIPSIANIKARTEILIK